MSFATGLGLRLHAATSTRRRRLGFGLLAAIVAFACLVPLLHGGDIASQNLMKTLAAPNAAEPFGTDHLGRSMIVRLAAAVRLSLGLAFLSVASAVIPGVAIGILGGWCGGIVDRIFVTLADSILALPGLLLVLILSAIAPGNFWALYVGISLVLWIEYYRVVRAYTQTIVSSPEIQSSRLLGFGMWYCVRRHILPEVVPVVLTMGAFGAASAIMAISALGFVNVGVRPPTAELGLMMTELFPYFDEAPLIMLQPIGMVFLLVLGLNLVAGSDPK